MDILLQQIINGLVLGSMYALIALGYTMVYGILKFINFAHSDVFALGVWMTIVWSKWLGLGQPGGAPTPWYMGALVLVLAMASCGLVGFVIERVAYKPLRSAPRLNVLITAIGVSLLLQNTGQLKFVFGPYPKPIPSLIDSTELFSMLGVSVRMADVAVIGTAAALMIAMQWLIFGTKLGAAMRAVSSCSRWRDWSVCCTSSKPCWRA